MSLVRRLYLQFRQLIHEGAKFLLVGGVGVVVTNVVYGVARHYGVGPISATVVATIVAMVVTYAGNRYWSFKHRERAGVAREGALFIVLNGIGLLIQAGLVGFNAYVLGFQHGHKLEQFLALNVAIAIATVFRFWSYRKWVWAAPAGPVAVPVDTAPGTPFLSANGHPGNGNGDRAALNGHQSPAARHR